MGGGGQHVGGDGGADVAQGGEEVGQGVGFGFDGVDAIETDATNCMNLPVEAMELDAPIRVRRWQLVPDSGGPGQFRGGLGQLKEYEILLPAQAAFWEAKNNPADTKSSWVQVDPQTLTATADVKLVRQHDGSITSSGGKSPSEYVIETSSSLTNITGVMLEVLPDESLPKFGPGRHKDGNFVLSELELKWASGTNKPDTSAKFVDARADYSQNDFSAKQAIDGKIETGKNGWAVSGAPGTPRHVATFKLEQPLSSTNGVNVRITLHQHFGEDFLIGRFRLHLTTSADPLDPGLPEGVVIAARAPAGQRKPEQAAAILAYHRDSDVEFWKRKVAVGTASDPLPADPKLVDLQKTLSRSEEPIVLDPYLVQLREDAKASGRQNENKRLTVVQDLTWALINSPGFLFNH